jgi:hypothetical protein
MTIRSAVRTLSALAATVTLAAGCASKAGSNGAATTAPVPLIPFQVLQDSIRALGDTARLVVIVDGVFTTGEWQSLEDAEIVSIELTREQGLTGHTEYDVALIIETRQFWRSRDSFGRVSLRARDTRTGNALLAEFDAVPIPRAARESGGTIPLAADPQHPDAEEEIQEGRYRLLLVELECSPGRLVAVDPQRASRAEVSIDTSLALSYATAKVEESACGTASDQATQLASDSSFSAPAIFDALAAKALAGDSVDYGELRLAWVRDERYSPYGSPSDEHFRRLRPALDADDLPLARSLLDSIIAFEFVSIAAHVSLADVAARMGDEAVSASHRRIANGMLRSILESGSGTNAAPWVVISVREEYALLHHLGLRMLRQGLTRCAGGQPCDALSVRNAETGEERELYFDVSFPMAFLDRLFPQ